MDSRDESRDEFWGATEETRGSRRKHTYTIIYIIIYTCLLNGYNIYTLPANGYSLLRTKPTTRLKSIYKIQQ